MLVIISYIWQPLALSSLPRESSDGKFGILLLLLYILDIYVQFDFHIYTIWMYTCVSYDIRMHLFQNETEATNQLKQ